MGCRDSFPGSASVVVVLRIDFNTTCFYYFMFKFLYIAVETHDHFITNLQNNSNMIYNHHNDLLILLVESFVSKNGF